MSEKSATTPRRSSAAEPARKSLGERVQAKIQNAADEHRANAKSAPQQVIDDATAIHDAGLLKDAEAAAAAGPESVEPPGSTGGEPR